MTEGVYTSHNPKGKKVRLLHFDYFRAFAIVMIVAGHCYRFWDIDTPVDWVLATMIKGGTAFFVFISGFFFHRIFYRNFDYRNFLLKKIRNVLFPYVLLSTLAYIIFVIYLGQPHPAIPPSDDGVMSGLLVFLKYAWTGRVLTAYWYIPFIMMVFALSPMFIRFIRLNVKLQVMILTASLIVSLVVQRPLHGLNPFHSVIYYCSIYFLGILFSLYEPQIMPIVRRWWFVLICLVVFFAVLQVKTYWSYDNFSKTTIFSFQEIDLMFLQKIPFILFAMFVLSFFATVKVPALAFLADVSFAIFFLHPWVLWLLTSYDVAGVVGFLPDFVVFLTMVSLVVLGSIAIALGVKQVFGTRSRYLIGW